MSLRRVFALCALVFVIIVTVWSLAYLSGAVFVTFVSVLAAVLVAGGLALGVALWRRAGQRLRTAGRHRLWPAVGVYFAAAALWGGLLGGGGWILVAVGACMVAASFLMHRREREVTLAVQGSEPETASE